MDLPINQLTTVSNAKEFSQRAKELEKSNPDPLAALVELDAATSRSLYDRFYMAAPCASFGVKATAVAAPLIPEDLRWRLFVREAWAVAKERQRSPFPVGSIRPYAAGSQIECFDYFRQAYLGHDFETAYAAVAGFLSGDSDREFFRQQSLELALQDTSHFGIKAVFLDLAWKLAQRGGWSHALDCLFPAFHFMVLADHEPATLENSSIRAGETEGSLTVEAYEKAEKALLWSAAKAASAALDALVASGVGTRQLYDALLLACARAVINSSSSNWAGPVRAFHFILLCRELDTQSSRPLKHIGKAAMLLNKAASASAETSVNRPVDDVVARVCPTDPIGVLKSVVSHSDPHASATAVLAGLGMPDDRREQLLRTLCAQAIKNDAGCSCAHDILYVVQAIDNWRTCQAPNRDLLPASAAYLIARLAKNYELAAEYGV